MNEKKYMKAIVNENLIFLGSAMAIKGVRPCATVRIIPNTKWRVFEPLGNETMLMRGQITLNLKNDDVSKFFIPWGSKRNIHDGEKK